MKVFVTGASGHIGSAVVPELLANGHSVVGLARSEDSAAAIEQMGAEAKLGTLDDLDLLAESAEDADGVIHLAYKHEAMYSGDLETALRADIASITAMGDALAGTGKPFVGTSGTALLFMGGIKGRPGTEEDWVDGPGRIANENAVIALADRDVRASVLRLPPTVHSDLDKNGFVPAIIGMARNAGYSAYVGEGDNRWPAVHTLDAARMYRLALERAKPGTRLHPVADEGVPFREIAERIGEGLGLETKSLPADAAADHFGFLTAFITVDNPTSSDLTREWTGWQPEHPGLIDDLREGHYFDD